MPALMAPALGPQTNVTMVQIFLAVKNGQRSFASTHVNDHPHIEKNLYLQMYYKKGKDRRP